MPMLAKIAAAPSAVLDAALTVAICTHNRPQLLDGLLSVLLPQLARLHIRLIVVDSASCPPAVISPEHVERYGDLVTLVRLDVAGISRARNAAFHHCVTPWIGYIDDDELPPSDWAHEALLLIARLPDSCAACSGNVTPQWPAAPPPAVGPRWLAYLSMLNRAGEFDQGRRTRFGVGHSLVRRDALAAVGEFDTSLGRDGVSLLSGEESHLVEVLLRRGWQIWHSDRITVAHVVLPARLERAWARDRAYWEGVSIMRRAQLGDFAWPWWIVASSYLKVMALRLLIPHVSERHEVDLIVAYAYGVLQAHAGIPTLTTHLDSAPPVPPATVEAGDDRVNSLAIMP